MPCVFGCSIESDPIKPDVELTAVKNVTLTEEYLADHFPEFPVLPGVFMLEAATQAGAWLLRLSENFAHSIISLKEARNVKYADFVAPGQTLDVTVSMLKKDDRLATLKVEGQIGDRQTLSGRIVLERYNLADRDPTLREIDEKIIQHFRRMQKLILPDGVGSRRRLTAAECENLFGGTYSDVNGNVEIRNLLQGARGARRCAGCR